MDEQLLRGLLAGDIIHHDQFVYPSSVNEAATVNNVKFTITITGASRHMNR